MAKMQKNKDLETAKTEEVDALKAVELAKVAIAAELGELAVPLLDAAYNAIVQHRQRLADAVVYTDEEKQEKLEEMVKEAAEKLEKMKQ